MINRRNALKGAMGVTGAMIMGGTFSSNAMAVSPNNYIASGIGAYGYRCSCTSSNIYAKDRYIVSIKNIQSHLHISADGVFGLQTDRAVRNFQKAHGLGVDGVVGNQTAAKLGLHWVSVSNW